RRIQCEASFGWQPCMGPSPRRSASAEHLLEWRPDHPRLARRTAACQRRLFTRDPSPWRNLRRARPRAAAKGNAGQSKGVTDRLLGLLSTARYARSWVDEE